MQATGLVMEKVEDISVVPQGSVVRVVRVVCVGRRSKVGGLIVPVSLLGNVCLSS